ncbi:MAG: hypothetical protein ABL899_00495 [Nitrospira sp.]
MRTKVLSKSGVKWGKLRRIKTQNQQPEVDHHANPAPTHASHRGTSTTRVASLDAEKAESQLVVTRGCNSSVLRTGLSEK